VHRLCTLAVRTRRHLASARVLAVTVRRVLLDGKRQSRPKRTKLHFAADKRAFDRRSSAAQGLSKRSSLLADSSERPRFVPEMLYIVQLNIYFKCSTRRRPNSFGHSSQIGSCVHFVYLKCCPMWADLHAYSHNCCFTTNRRFYVQYHVYM